MHFTRNLPILYTATAHVSKHQEPSSASFTNCSLHWSQQSLYLLKGLITLSVKSEMSVIQKCRVQARTGHFAICTQQTTSTSVTSNCVPTSDDGMVLRSQFFHSNLAPVAVCIPCSQKSGGFSGETLIMFHDLVAATSSNCPQCQSQMRLIYNL